MYDLVLMDHQTLLHLLNGDGLAGLATAAQPHLSKGPSTDNLNELIVAYAHAPASQPQLLGLFVEDV